jgi:hypothetical protein
MTNNHASLPPPYDVLLAPADLARYGDMLPARQRDTLQQRLAGFLYAHIGNRLGTDATGARALVRRACERLYQAKQQAEAPPGRPADDAHAAQRRYRRRANDRL